MAALMPQPSFHPVKIGAARQETPLLTHLTLADVSTELLAAYKTPGQYVQIQEGGLKPGYFAIACGPGRGTLEFLLKRGTPLADLLCAKQPGATLQIGAPAGKGYPLEHARGHDLYLCGVGSGIAPLRAVVHAVLRERQAFCAIKFYYGARRCEDFPYANELDSWLAHGVEVTRVCSQPEPGTWNASIGHIQDALRARRLVPTPGDCVFACGMKPLVEDLKVLFTGLGLPAERVFQNF